MTKNFFGWCVHMIAYDGICTFWCHYVHTTVKELTPILSPLWTLRIFVCVWACACVHIPLVSLSFLLFWNCLSKLLAPAYSTTPLNTHRSVCPSLSTCLSICLTSSVPVDTYSPCLSRPCFLVDSSSKAHGINGPCVLPCPIRWKVSF